MHKKIIQNSAFPFVSTRLEIVEDAKFKLLIQETNPSFQLFTETESVSLIDEDLFFLLAANEKEEKLLLEKMNEADIALSVLFEYTSDILPTACKIEIHSLENKQYAFFIYPGEVKPQTIKSHERELAERLIELAPEAVYINDLKGNFIAGNSNAETLIGYKKQELIGKNFLELDVLPRRFIPKALKNVFRAILGKSTGPDEFILNTRDGNKVKVKISTHPLILDRKKVVIGIAQDITNLEENRKRVSMLSSLVAHSDNIVVVKDLDLRVIATNMAFVEAAGFKSVDDLIGKTDSEIYGLSPESEPVKSYMEDERRAQTMQPGEYILKEEPCYFADGSAHIFLTKKYPIYDENNKLIATGSISMNITESKKTENKLKDALAAAKKSREEADKANKAKSAFLATMSHEIRTPLNAIIGMTDMALITSEGEEKLNYLTIVKQSGHVLLQIINDILDFSKIEAGNLLLEEKFLYLPQLIYSIELLFRESIENKGITFRIKQSNNLPAYILGDEIRLSQILMNLLSNALKFTEQGEICFSISSENIDKSHCKLTFTIQDSGIGIAKDKQQSIFDKFHQADLSTTRKFGGSGLGLSIVKELTILMHGNISLKSSPGEGSEFRITIPFETELSLQKERALNPHRKRERKENLNILLAEDNSINAYMAETIIKKLKHRVTHVENGESCLIALTQNHYDIILMDVEMPLLDGIDTTIRIRNGDGGPGHKDIPILAMTAHAVTDIKERCIEAGMDGYVTKPLDISLLQSQIEEVIASKKVYSENE